MKSAYDRALERFGSDPIQKLTDEQKVAIAEVERKYKARIAAAELHAKEAIAKAAGDPAKEQQARDDMTTEIASLRGKLASEKDKIRNAKQ